MTEEAGVGQGSPHSRRCRRRAERAKQPSTHNVQLNLKVLEGPLQLRGNDNAGTKAGKSHAGGALHAKEECKERVLALDASKHILKVCPT